MNPETRELMSTAMEHNKKLFSEALKDRHLVPERPAQKPMTEEQAAKKAILDSQLKSRIAKLQQKYAGKLSPERMQAIHNQMATSIQPGAAMAPSTAAVVRRALTNGYPGPASGTLEPTAPYLPTVNGIQITP